MIVASILYVNKLMALLVGLAICRLSNLLVLNYACFVGKRCVLQACTCVA